MKFRMWFRSAITGRFVKKQESQDNPQTTVRERPDSGPMDTWNIVVNVQDRPPDGYIWRRGLWYPLGKK